MPEKTEKTAPSSPFRRVARALRMTLLLILLGMALLLIPPVFRLAVRLLVSEEAWRRGAAVWIGEVKGSLYEPVALLRSKWTLRRRGGSVTQIDIARLEAEFAWREILPKGSGRWFRRLTLQGVTGTFEMPVGTGASTPAPVPEAPPASDWWPTPSRIEASGVDLFFRSEDDYVRVQNSRWSISALELGYAEAELVSVKQPWLNRTFRNVHGTTALQTTALHENRLSIADLTLDPAIQISSFSAEPSKIARGRLDLVLLVNAFGGQIHAQAQTIPHAHGVELDASGNFSHIDIAAMATFLGISDAAGGVIQAGNFTFVGLPQEPALASASVRLEATNFQWESRQWDSLALGATLLDRRVQIPELRLRQGHNQLSLNGDLALPLAHKAWWDSDFSFKIAADLGNLTELSALLLPEFKYAAGAMKVKGDVTGKDQQFLGNLDVSGSDITWRNAPIQELTGSILLAGREMHVLKLKLRNKDDYISGQGSISLSGPLEYHGDLHASIGDLSTYAAIQEKPLVPQPLAGAAVVWWTGEGTAKGQTGRFFARLQRLRPLGLSDPLLHPVDVEMEGSYKPESLSFSRFGVSDEDCSLSAAVEVAAKTLGLKGIRLMHGSELWLEGDALLPLDIWQAWPKTTAVPLLAEDAPGKVALKASGLSLEPALRLTGWKWPIQGIVDGAVNVDGRIGKLTSSGQFTLHDGRFTLGWNGPPLSAVNGDFSLGEQAITVERLQARSDNGLFAPTGERGDLLATGKIDFTHFRDPLLQLELAKNYVSLHVPWNCGIRGANQPSGAGREGIAVDTVVKLHLDGPLSAALVHGEAEIYSIHPQGAAAQGPIDLSDFWRMPQLPEFPPLLQLTTVPFNAWRLAIDFTGTSPYAPQLRLSGTGAAPLLVGAIHFPGQGEEASCGPIPVQLVDASITFREANQRDPTLDLTIVGEVDGTSFQASALGPVTRPLFYADRALAVYELTGRKPLAETESPLRLEPGQVMEALHPDPWLIRADRALAEYERIVSTQYAPIGRSLLGETKSPLRLDYLPEEVIAAIHPDPWPLIEGAPAPTEAPTNEMP